MASLDAFSTAAREYVALIEERDQLSAEELLTRAESRLLTLYLLILQVPLAFPEDDRPNNPFSNDAVVGIMRSLSGKLASFDLYRAVFDPYESVSENPVNGSLSDDLAEIYGDLKRGLARWESEDKDEASYEWRFGFEFHWGRHLVSALQAIYALHFDHRWTVPPLAQLSNRGHR